MSSPARALLWEGRLEEESRAHASDLAKFPTNFHTSRAVNCVRRRSPCKVSGGERPERLRLGPRKEQGRGIAGTAVEKHFLRLSTSLGPVWQRAPWPAWLM